MEKGMLVNIKKNEYRRPTTVCVNTVQAICDAFLAGNMYFPREHVSVAAGGADGFKKPGDFKKPGEIAYVFNGVEMETAFRELIKAGYHMFKINNPEYHITTGYKCSCKPFVNSYLYVCTEVFSFDCIID